MGGGNQLMSKKNRLSKIILAFLMWMIAVVFFCPIYYLIVSTFKSAEEMTRNPFGLPGTFDLSGYIVAWQKMNYPRAFTNTFIIAVLTVVTSILLASFAAYSIARYKSKFNKFVFTLVLAGMMLPGQVSMVSLYNLVKGLGLVDNIFGIVVITCAGNAMLPLFLFRSFITTSIPIEIEEAAQIDGCGLLKRFFLVVLPLLKPVVATAAIIIALGTWNDYLNPMLFLQSRENATLLIEVNRNIGQFAIDWTSMFPMLVLAVLPLSIFYFIMQKQIISGVAAGAVKG